MTVGIPPGTGPQLIDGIWAQGVAAGLNSTYISGITAAGSTQSGAFQLSPGFALVEIDTASSAQGVALPEAVAGMEITIFNNTAQTNLVVYPAIANNQLTGAQDTINNASSFTMGSARTPYLFSCAKNGVWSAK